MPCGDPAELRAHQSGCFHCCALNVGLIASPDDTTTELTDSDGRSAS
jgi:hypothetical protein